MFTIPNFPEELSKKRNAALFTGILRGLEREALRVDQNGHLALSPHPQELGSALTHPHITTDFSEALLEFITPPTHRGEDLFEHLQRIHTFVAGRLNNELLWPNSMPCFLKGDDDIPVAQYGSSNNARMKTTYRVGLGHRYGRNMQTVAGVHYNFSLPNAFWAHFQRKENSLLRLEEFKNQGYFKLIRNFRRHFWLLIYLFGASPAMCPSFVGRRQHALEEDAESGALHLPHATSLRMGDLGYQSSAQESLYVCYNSVDSYISTLCGAIRKPYDSYTELGLKNGNGEYKQLNTSLLQIENEFYSAIRPKRSAQPGETALTALGHRGVEYIEVRCLDLNPFDPLGFSPEQMHFIDCFLIYCALAPSPDTDMHEWRCMLDNQKRVVNEGRKPGLELDHPQLGKVSLQTWADSLLDAMQPVAAILDNAQDSEVHQESLDKAKFLVADSDQCPSAKVLEQIRQHKSYSQATLALAQKHTEALKAQTLSADDLKAMLDMAEESLAKQAEMERESSIEFDQFLKNYYAQYNSLCPQGCGT